MEFLLRPMWRAPAASVLVALILRLLHRPLAMLAVLAGWLAVQYPAFSVLPANPVDRLPGLAVLVLGLVLLAPRARGVAAMLALPAFAAVAAWWMAGAPVTGPGLADCVPVFLGVWAAAALTRRLAVRDTGWAGIFAALALAAAIFFAGGSPHWARAALVPACVGAVLLGLPQAAPALALATMLLACLTILASDRGRFLPVDMTALAPLLVWLLAPRLLPRLKRAGPALAALLAAAGAVGVTIGAARLLAWR